MAYVNIAYLSSSGDLSYDSSHYLINASGGDVTVTLPQIAGDGYLYNIHKMNNAAHDVVIAPYSGDTINVGNITLGNLETARLLSFSNTWYRL
jgi:hypothetical protein